MEKQYKYFISYYLEGEERKSKYQIYFASSELHTKDGLQLPYDYIILRNGLYIYTFDFKDKFLRKFFVTDPMEVDAFLDFHLEEYFGEQKDFFKQIDLLFSENNFTYLRERYEIEDGYFVDHYHIEDHLLGVRMWLAKYNPKTKTSKFKWKGKPAQFGYIFYQLAVKGYIEYPGSNEGYSPKNFAKHCLDHFDIDTSSDNLARELSKKTNSLTNKEAYKIP